MREDAISLMPCFLPLSLPCYTTHLPINVAVTYIPNWPKCSTGCGVKRGEVISPHCDSISIRSPKGRHI